MAEAVLAPKLSNVLLDNFLGTKLGSVEQAEEIRRAPSLRWCRDRAWLVAQVLYEICLLERTGIRSRDVLTSGQSGS